MADRESRVKLSVVDNFSGPLAKFAGGMNGAYAGAQGLKQGLQTLAGGGGGVAGAVIKTVIDATKYTIQWAGEIDTLSRITGTGARETSKLAIVFGDVGIGMDVLRSSARKMASEGLELNFQSIVKLAKEYQALPPGLERSRFAMEKFGRAGIDMSEILDRDISEIEQLGRAAEKSGKIIGDDFVKKAEKMETGMHQLQDRMEGFKLLVGGPVIETVNKAAAAFDDYVGIYQLLYIKAQQATGALDDQTASIKAAELAGLSRAEAIRQVYGEDDRATAIAHLSTKATVNLGAANAYAARWAGIAATEEKKLADSMYDQASAAQALAAGLSGPLKSASEQLDSTLANLKDQYDANRDGTISATEGLEEFRAKSEEAKEAAAKVTNEMLFQAAAAAGLTDPALTELAFSMGLIDEKSYNAQKAMDALTKRMLDGKIGPEEYAKKTKELADAINAIQDKHITITTENINIKVNRTISEQAGAGYGTASGVHGYQFGGLIPAFQSLMVGERGPELLRLDRPGRVQSDTTGGGAGGNAPMATEILAALRALPLQMKLALRGA